MRRSERVNIFKAIPWVIKRRSRTRKAYNELNKKNRDPNKRIDVLSKRIDFIARTILMLIDSETSLSQIE